MDYGIGQVGNGLGPREFDTPRFVDLVPQKIHFLRDSKNRRIIDLNTCQEYDSQ